MTVENPYAFINPECGVMPQWTVRNR